MSRALIFGLALAVLAGCSSPASEGQGGGGSPAASGAGGMPAHDGSGYAIVGRVVNPPLFHRVEALPCPESSSAECTTDDDCGPGMACVCLETRAACAPAECLSDQDCAPGFCLLSRGRDADCCASHIIRGLYCERAASTCVDGGDCPGNGQACVYIATANRFECGILTCPEC